MALLKDIALFYSSESKPCQICLNAIHKHQFEIVTIPLDNSKIRNVVSKGGKYFKIEHVPTLLMVFDDNNVKLFVGLEKIMNVFESFINQRKAQLQIPKQEIEVEEPEKYEKVKQVKRSKRKKRKQHEILQIPTAEIPTKGLSVISEPKTNSMSELLLKAKQMEDQRQSTLKESGFGNASNKD